MSANVTAVSRSESHSFSKRNEQSVQLLAGLGVQGDAHMGKRVKHRFDVLRHPFASNLRQVHLLHEELFDELRTDGFHLYPGAIGENVTTCGLDLLGMPKGTRLRLGTDAVVELTGLRDPCIQLDAFAPGLKSALLGR